MTSLSNVPRGQRKPGDDVPNPFIGSTSYSAVFADFGALPKANIKEQKKFVAGFGNVDGVSTYQDVFNRSKEINPNAAEEKERLIAQKKHHQKGNLAPSSPVPFKGESFSHGAHAKPTNATGVQKHVPFDMVSLP